MHDRRPVRVILALVAAAVVSAVGSGTLDTQGNWGQPHQAIANILWIVFLLSVLSLVVVGARLLVHRRTAAGR